MSLDFDATFQAATVQAAEACGWMTPHSSSITVSVATSEISPAAVNRASRLVADAAGRPDPRKRPMVVKLGLAMEDIATALPLYHCALEQESGTILAL